MLFALQYLKNRLALDYKCKKNKIPQESRVDIDGKFVAFCTETPKDRNALLQEFITLRNKLNSIGQHCTFLAIDVVDSTEMKATENQHSTIYDFDRYNRIAIICLFISQLRGVISKQRKLYHVSSYAEYRFRTISSI